MSFLLKEKRIDAVVLNQSTDLFYYTGSVLPLYCVISSKGDAFVLAPKSLVSVPYNERSVLRGGYQ
jgi:hypothetical protein